MFKAGVSIDKCRERSLNVEADADCKGRVLKKKNSSEGKFLLIHNIFSRYELNMEGTN